MKNNSYLSYFYDHEDKDLANLPEPEIDDKALKYLENKYIIKSYENNWKDICNRIGIIIAINSIEYYKKYYDIEFKELPNMIKANFYADLYTSKIILNSDILYHIGEIQIKYNKELAHLIYKNDTFDYNISKIDSIISIYNSIDCTYFNYDEDCIFIKRSHYPSTDNYIKYYKDVLSNKSIIFDDNKVEKPVSCFSINLMKFLKVKDNERIEFEYDKFRELIRRSFDYLSIINKLLKNKNHNIGLGILGLNTIKLLFNDKDSDYLVSIMIKDIFKYLKIERDNIKKSNKYLKDSNVYWYSQNIEDPISIFGLEKEDIFDYLVYDKEIFKGKCTSIQHITDEYVTVDDVTNIIETCRMKGIYQIQFHITHIKDLLNDDNKKECHCKECTCEKHNKNIESIKIDELQEKLKSDDELYDKVFEACVNSKRPSIIKNTNEINNPFFGYGISVTHNTPYGKVCIDTKYDDKKIMRQILINIIESNIDNNVFEYQSLLNSIASLISFILQISNENTKEILQKIKNRLYLNINGAISFEYDKHVENDIIQVIQSKSLIQMIINTLIDIDKIYQNEEKK